MTEIKSDDWVLFGSMLTILLIAYFIDIIDQLLGFLLIVAASCILLFKNYFIGEIFSIDECHVSFLRSLNDKRWLSLYFLAIAVIFFRIIDMAGYLVFNSLMALVFLITGLLFVFKREVIEYISYFEKKRTIRPIYEIEAEIVDSLYSFRMLSFLVISGIGVSLIVSINALEYSFALIGYLLLMGLVIYYYEYSIKSNRNIISSLRDNIIFEDNKIHQCSFKIANT
jgi:hypothetical protein